MTGSIDDIIKGLEDYKKSLKAKADALVRALAEAGCEGAKVSFSGSGYMGDNDVDVTVEDRGEGKYAIVANGRAVLFLEFGAGVTLGYGHPNPMQYGPGTYPGKGHWNDPRGWYLPKKAGGGHTYGNPPTAAMYYTGKSLRGMIAQVAREVFGG